MGGHLSDSIVESARASALSRCAMATAPAKPWAAVLLLG